jgi:hypothetical protein
VTKGQDSECGKVMFPNDYFICDESGGDDIKKLLEIFGLEYNDFIDGEDFIFRDQFIKSLIKKYYSP